MEAIKTAKFQKDPSGGAFTRQNTDDLYDLIKKCI